MFTVLAIGDPHFKGDNGESTTELTEKVDALIDTRLEELNAIVILGDILHRHEKIDLHPFHRAMTFLERIHDKICNHDIFLYIIIGNHDRSNNQVFMTDEHVFNPLKKWKNTIVVDKAIIHTPKPEISILLVPYVPTGRFQEAYNTVISEEDLQNKILAVFAHQEFAGAKMNTITSEEGDSWDILNPVCISGHIHDYQRPKANIVYTGTPIQHGFADMGKKTVSIFKIHSKNRFEEERIDLKIKGRIIIKGNISNFDESCLLNDNFYIKAKLMGTSRQIKTFKDSKKYTDAISKGVIFQFLELPTVEVEQKNNIELLNIIHAGKTFSQRLLEMRSGLEENLRNEFDDLFKS